LYSALTFGGFFILSRSVTLEHHVLHPVSLVQSIRFLPQHICSESPESSLDSLPAFRIGSNAATCTSRSSKEALKVSVGIFIIIERSMGHPTKFSTQKQTTSRSEEIRRKITHGRGLEKRCQIRNCF
jgi:hypothetical protein